jgi:hypothetical protein
MAALGGGLIVTDDIAMPDAASFRALGAQHGATAARLAAVAELLNNENASREIAARSPGFEVGHTKMRQAHVAAAEGAQYYGRLSGATTAVAAAIDAVSATHASLVAAAQAELCRPGAAHAEIIQRYQALARRATEDGVAAMSAAVRASVSGPGAPRMSALTAMLSAGGGAGVPAAPARGVDEGQSTTDPGHRGDYAGSQHAGPQTDTQGTSVADPGHRGDYEDKTTDGSAAADEVTADTGTSETTATDPGRRSDYTTTGSPADTSAADSAMPVMSGGSLPAGGGGVGSGAGMGSAASPLSRGSLGGTPPTTNPLGSGLGQVSAAPGSAPGGLSDGAAATAAPSQLGLAQGFPAVAAGTTTGAPAAAAAAPRGSGSGMPAPLMPSLTDGSAAPGAPAAAAAPGRGIAPAAAAAGMVSPAASQPSAAAAAPAGMGMAVPPVAMPPGSMSPPAAVSVSPTTPASGGTASSTQSGPAPPTATGAGATLIPAAVVAAGQSSAAHERRESADCAAARALVYRLQAAAIGRGYPIQWAVGVFRSPSGTETVIHSNDGASFVPAGVPVPRSCRVLAADTLVDNHFRARWFGWDDPAQVLVEYGRLRADTGWKLVAAATTGAVGALRGAGVEHPPSCEWETSPHRLNGPALDDVIDDMHQHRLSAVWPEMYPRVLRIMQAAPVYQDRVIRQAAARMIHAASTLAVPVGMDGIPAEFRSVWAVRNSGEEPTARAWAAYYAAGTKWAVQVALARPGFAAVGDEPHDAAAREIYCAHWLVARTAELVGGWSAHPLPLPDMVYAAITVLDDETGARREIEDAVSSVEEDLRLMGELP